MRTHFVHLGSSVRRSPIVALTLVLAAGAAACGGFENAPPGGPGAAGGTATGSDDVGGAGGGSETTGSAGATSTSAAGGQTSASSSGSGSGGAATSSSTGAPPPVCSPGATQECYSGPAATKGVGVCAAGVQTCSADGSAWGSDCAGQVLPSAEICFNAVDEDCDGTACAAPLWSHLFGSAANETVKAMAVGPNGQIVVVGEMNGSVDFGGGTLTSAGGIDIFVAAYDAQGHPLWSERFGALGDQSPNGVAIDAQGNVIVVGQSEGSFAFGGYSLAGTLGDHDAFVAKLDAEGTPLFASKIGQAGTQRFNAVAVDAQGDIGVVGDFDGTLSCGWVCLTSKGEHDIFVQKFSSTGTLLFSKTFGDASDQTGTSVAFTPSGSLVIGGTFTGAVPFGNGQSLVGASTRYGYLAELDETGLVLWARSIVASPFDGVTGITVDAANEVFVTGTFATQLGIDGTWVKPANPVPQAFVLKVGASRSISWATVLDATMSSTATSIATNAAGEAIVTGSYAGTMNIAGTSLGPSAHSDVFLVKLSNAGLHLWSHGFGDGAAQQGNAVAVAADGSVTVAAQVQGSIDLGGGLLTSAGSNDVGLARFSP